MAKSAEFLIAITFGVISLRIRIVKVTTKVSIIMSAVRLSFKASAMSAVISAANMAIALFTIVFPVRRIIRRRFGFWRSDITSFSSLDESWFLSREK